MLGVYVTVTDARDHGIGDVVFVVALVPPYVFGRIARRLASTTSCSCGSRETRAPEAVRDERDRIARELHDVIAHSVSAMVVQVAAVQDLVRTDPARAEEMLARVAETGRRAIGETGRLLHVIRDADDELELAPTPRLRDLDDLVREFERDGLEVELVDRLPEQVPAAVDVSAYRVVREALTNALRFAPDRRVRVEIAGTDAGLTIPHGQPGGRRPPSVRVSAPAWASRGSRDRWSARRDHPARADAVRRVRARRERARMTKRRRRRRPGPGAQRLELVLEARGCRVVGTRGQRAGRRGDRANRLAPGVVVMDVRMPVLDGIAATRRSPRPGCPTRCSC